MALVYGDEGKDAEGVLVEIGFNTGLLESGLLGEGELVDVAVHGVLKDVSCYVEMASRKSRLHWKYRLTKTMATLGATFSFSWTVFASASVMMVFYLVGWK